MSHAAPAPAFQPAPPVPRWLAAVFLCLLVLPFHPLWVDFEQVRRGLLLMAAGAGLLLLPRLPAVHGERAALGLLGFFVAGTTIVWLGQVFLRAPNQPLSFQPWEAAYRLAHWLALWVALRLGAACRDTSALPVAVLLLVTSAFGLLQRLGLGELQGYGVEREPVSVFGNLNVASEWTAVAAMLTAALLPRLATPRRAAIGLAALTAAGAYLVVNLSRSGLIALPIGLLLLVVLQRRAALRPLLATGAGMLLGLLVAGAVARPPAADQLTLRNEQKRATSTLQVRFEIAKATTRLFAESPVFGHGAGQFAVQYPRHRTQDEIEWSSHGRQFATEVRTAHDDWLELLVDGGLPALALFALVLFALQRAQPDKALLLPLLVLLLLMLVRAPLWNAPAAVAAVWTCGVTAPLAARARWRRPLAIALGLLLVGLGLLPVLGNSRAAGYQAAVRLGDAPPPTALPAAAWWMPFEPRWQQLIARERLRANDLPAARIAAARAVALRPFDPQAYELLVEILITGKAYDRAAELVQHALRLDPVHPELRMWSSWLAMQRGEAEPAILAVVDKPHAALRAQLKNHFAALQKAAATPALAARFEVEHRFLVALEQLGDREQATREAFDAEVRELTGAMKRAEYKDARPVVLGALQLLELDQPGADEDARLYGKGAAKLGPLPAWQQELFGSRLDRLRQFDTWQPVLGKR
jgi:O-antigen ligase